MLNISISPNKLEKSYKINPTEMEEKASKLESKNELISFVDELINDPTVLQSDENDTMTDELNFYYCPQFIQNFKDLCYTFPSWTNITRKHFQSPNIAGTSSRSETYFRMNKSKTPHPISGQKFILKDNKKIKSLVNHASSKI